MLRHVTTRFCGVVILIAGIWGGLIPFVGPYFHFVLGPASHWHWTMARLWLSVIPGAVAVIGGLMLLGSGPRATGKLGALLGIAAGAWFAIGPDVSMLWNHGVSAQGAPYPHRTFVRMLEYLTFHSGLGVLIVAFAAYALPGVLVTRRGRLERDAAVAGTGAAAGAAAEAHHRDRVAEREGAGTGRTGAVAGDGSQHRLERDAALAGTGAAVGAAAEAHHRNRTAERESGTTGAERGTTGAERERGAFEPGTSASPETRQAGNGAPAESADGEPVAADRGAASEEETSTRRSGGLFGRFSRR